MEKSGYDIDDMQIGPIDIDHMSEYLMDIVREAEMTGVAEILPEIIDIIRINCDKNAPDLSRIGMGNKPINVIPSNTKAACTPELLVLCMDEDSLTERLRDMVYHVTFDCPGICQSVLLITTKWDGETYRVHRSALEGLKKKVRLNIALVIGRR